MSPGQSKQGLHEVTNTKFPAESDKCYSYYLSCFVARTCHISVRPGCRLTFLTPPSETFSHISTLERLPLSTAAHTKRDCTLGDSQRSGWSLIHWTLSLLPRILFTPPFFFLWNSACRLAPLLFSLDSDNFGFVLLEHFNFTKTRTES